MITVFLLYFLLSDLISLFQESIWDEYYHIKERISDYRISSDLIIVEYDLNTFKELGPIEENVSIWRETILKIASFAKVVAIDCGLGEENVQQAPSLKLRDIPANVVFPLYATGITTKNEVLEGASWKPLCLKYFRNTNINYGHTVFYIDRDGVVRKVPAQIIVKDDSKPAISIASLQLFGRKDVKFIEAGGASLLYLGGKKILLEKAGVFRPEFIPYEKFKRISFKDILSGRTGFDSFRNKIVLIGINLPNWGLQYLYPQDKQRLSSSLVLQASIINSLLNESIFSRPPESIFIFLIVFIVFVLAVIFARTNVLASAVIALVSVFFWFGISFLLYTKYILVDSVIVPLSILLSFAFVHALLHAEEAREKLMVESIFSRYLKPEIVQKIVENPEKALESLKGTTREATVLFADIRGFTSFCENKKPEEVVKKLNSIFEKATEVIFSEDGMIDKFIGDGIMVLFNVPDDQNDHADRAVRTAIKIMEAMKEMGEGLVFGIGINSGEVVAGNIGSSKRMEYTAIGDTVNTASRICSVAKGGEILISEETKLRLKGDFLLEEAGEWSLKGKSGKIKLYRVLYDYN